MKSAQHIINMIKKVVDFEKKSEEENIKLCFYSLFEWARENGHRLFCTCHYNEKNHVVSFDFFFNPDGNMMAAEPGAPGEFNFEIRVKGGVDDLYDKLILVLAFSEAKMKELSDNYFPDGFLGGDNDNDFF